MMGVTGMPSPNAPDRQYFEVCPHLTDAQHDLYDRMSEISEDCLCAGWIYGNEYNIWAAITLSEPAPAYGPINPRLLRRCQQLADETGGWIYWDDGPQFAPMAQWLAMVAQHNDAGNAGRTVGLSR